MMFAFVGACSIDLVVGLMRRQVFWVWWVSSRFPLSNRLWTAHFMASLSSFNAFSPYTSNTPRPPTLIEKKNQKNVSSSENRIFFLENHSFTSENSGFPFFPPHFPSMKHPPPSAPGSADLVGNWRPLAHPTDYCHTNGESPNGGSVMPPW